MKTVVIVAKSKKEAKQIALREYGTTASYLEVYHYGSKGNNFYTFQLNPNQQ